MRMISTIILAGLASLAGAGAAVAAERDVHVIKVKLPDGSIQQIRYRGDIPPRFVVVPVRVRSAQAANPFAAMERMRAEMDRRMDAMMRMAARAEASAPRGSGVTLVSNGRALPPGTVSYSSVTTSNGAATCTRSVRVISMGPDKPVKVEKQSAGDCATAASAPAGSAPSRAPRAAKPRPAPKPQSPVDHRRTV
jgi:hypothetical protein